MKLKLIASSLLVTCAISSQPHAHQEEDMTEYSEEVQAPEKPAPTHFVTHLAGAHINLSGHLVDEFFLYNHARTLRSDISDANDFFRHRLDLDLAVAHGKKECPISQAFIRLTNYVYWQQNDQYMPMYTPSDPRIDLNTSSPQNALLEQNLPVRTLLPLIFVEQAWWQINLNELWDRLPCGGYLKAGFFPFMVGRGVSLGYHNDLGVDYLGMPGEGGFTRYPTMPPGVLLHIPLIDCLSIEGYYMQWRETNASLSDVLAPKQLHILNREFPERGCTKDRYNLVLRLLHEYELDDCSKLNSEPYWVFTRAPEQSIEFEADASATLHTIGCMVNYESDRFSVNVELAGQFGTQFLHPVDRNSGQLGVSSQTGAVEKMLSHLGLVNSSGLGTPAPAQDVGSSSTTPTFDQFTPEKNLEYIANLDKNRNETATQIKDALGNNASVKIGTSSVPVYNSQRFGNKRIRPGYKLSHQGFMALADVAYHCECSPITIGGAAGFIGGGPYPYNDETSRTIRHFVPMRSRYTGLHVHNMLIFDRLVIPRPLNVSEHTLYAFNNLKDLNNLQFLGVSWTWYPCKDENKCALRTDMMALWEVGRVYRWDRSGKHPDQAIENQLNGTTGDLRKRYGFEGWQSCKKASRMIGLEIDVQFDYKIREHCMLTTRGAVLFPGKLYKHLLGQPNSLTRRVDFQGLSHYESLGDKVAYGLMVGGSYRF